MRPTPLRLLNRASVRHAVARAATNMGLQNPVLVVTTPNGVDAAGVAGTRNLVYYCVDDFTRWPGVDTMMAAAMERELIARADLILATSAHLATTRRAREVLSHGVDAPHFARASDPTTVPHPGVRRTNPVVGYLGLLDARFDVELVASVARARPTWDWVLVGPTDGDVDARLVLPNLRIIPAVPYATLPAVLAAFDVAVLPYVRNELTRAINPLKLREYLASGRPVVATSLPEVIRYAPDVHIADTVDDTLAAIEACLADTPSQRSARMKRVADESWDARAARFVSLCQEVNTR
jgi:glycosyltransferase involved in cell wall biosynthesis